MDLVSEDATTRRKGIAFLQDVARAMKCMGGTIMAGVNYSSWPRRLLPGEEKEVLTDRAVEGVREAIRAAEDCGVLFCVEVVNRFEQFIMNTAAEGIAFAERVGSPNCKILLDTFHMNIEEDSLGGSIREAGDWLGHFHLGEPNRRPPGCGRMPIRDGPLRHLSLGLNATFRLSKRNAAIPSTLDFLDAFRQHGAMEMLLGTASTRPSP